MRPCSGRVGFGAWSGDGRERGFGRREGDK